MAARLNRLHQSSVREKIKAQEYLRMLGQHVRGKLKMTPTQVGAAQYLVNQSIGCPPQMTDVQFTGSMQVNDISDKPLSAEEWAAQADHMGADTGAAETSH